MGELVPGGSDERRCSDHKNSREDCGHYAGQHMLHLLRRLHQRAGSAIMRFGTIGAGPVALAFAREALRAGHQVVLSNRRGPESLANLVAELGNGAAAAPAAE